MNELDETWSRMLALSLENARASGRGDVADYLALKQSNDAVRRTSIDWLFDSLVEIAAEANRSNSAIAIEREDPHEFPFRGARLAGSLRRVRLGVRCMTVEAGWTRTPEHGFMRGGALAGARIVHFGIPKAGAELLLVRVDDLPVWRTVEGATFDLNALHEHFRVFLGDDFAAA